MVLHYDYISWRDEQPMEIVELDKVRLPKPKPRVSNLSRLVEKLKKIELNDCMEMALENMIEKGRRIPIYPSRGVINFKVKRVKK